jgi:hypothetical protein
VYWGETQEKEPLERENGTRPIAPKRKALRTWGPGKAACERREKEGVYSAWRLGKAAELYGRGEEKKARGPGLLSMETGQGRRATWEKARGPGLLSMETGTRP